MKQSIREAIEFLEKEFLNEVAAAYSVKDHPHAYDVFRKRAEGFEKAMNLLKLFLREAPAD